MSATKLAETRHRTLHRASKKIAVLATCQLVILHISLCGVSSQDSVVVAYTDTTQFVVGGTIFAYTEHDYHMFTERRSFVVKTKEKPAHLSNDARFGYNLAYGGINRSWILDGNDVHGYMLYVDLNADGSLRNDAPLTFEHQGDSYSLVLKTTQKEIIDGKEQTYPVEIKLEITHAFHPGHKEQTLALNNYFTERNGVLRVGAFAVPFTISGMQGIYNESYNGVAFDLNNDGHMDPTEKYAGWERYVNIGDRTYEYIVDRYGRKLVLILQPEHRPDRATLQPDSQAPDFVFEDLDHKKHRLSDLANTVVLLDFWGTWCAPCVIEAPQLAATYHKLHGRGFEIISIDNGEDSSTVRTFANKNKMSWLHTVEDGNGDTHRLYRVNGWPTYYLIDKQGNITSNSLRPGDEMTKEIERLCEQ